MDGGEFKVSILRLFELVKIYLEIDTLFWYVKHSHFDFDWIVVQSGVLLKYAIRVERLNDNAA